MAPPLRFIASIFQLTGHDFQYFCAFFESTKGKRFYRAGGVYKGITGVREALEDKKIEAKFRSELESIFKVSANGNVIPDGWITKFVKLNRREFETVLPQLSSVSIKKMLFEKWDEFVRKEASRIMSSMVL